MKTVITTDLHGCSLEFQALLRKAKLNREEDELIVLGDLFDRGTHSYEVFRAITKLKAEMGSRFHLIRGNHDQFFLDNLNSEESMALWAYNGGVRTIESFGRHGVPLEEARELLESSVLYYETDQFIAVHAGLRSEIPSENPPEVLLWDRSVIQGSYTGKLGIGGHTPLKHPIWFLPDHTMLQLPYETTFPLPDKGFICMDTGCVFGGVLTGMIIEGEEFHLTSMPKKDY